MSAIDIVLLLIVATAALTGYMRGLLRSVVGLAGFAAGALLGSLFGAKLVGHFFASSHTISSAIGFFVGGFIGFALTGLFSGVMRKVLLPWSWLRVIDSIAGAILLAVVALGFAWVVVDLMGNVGGPAASGVVANSKVIATVNKYTPSQLLMWGHRLSDKLAQNPLPSVFTTIVTGQAPYVAPPSATVIPLGAEAAIGSVVRIQGSAPQCQADITGSGFIVGPNRVVTNAHVVAGVQNPHVQVGGRGTDYSAIVVGIDRKLDIAVLDVPELTKAALAFGGPAVTNEQGVTAGFPGGRGLVTSMARIGPTTQLAGVDIDGQSSAPRNVIVFAGHVEHGDSGGPLLDAHGKVLGMVFASAQKSTSVGFALRPIDIVPLVLKTANMVAPVDTGNCAQGITPQ